MRFAARATAALGAIALATAGALLTAAPAAAVTATTTYSAPGGYSFVVPLGVSSLHVEALGGSGGGSWSGRVGGAGALLTADIPVTPGATVYVHVAGNGSLATAGDNGGGGAPGFGGAGGGGGASDVREAGDTLAARILVAGGGGGLDGFISGAPAGSDSTNGGGCADPAATAGSLVAGGTGGGGCDGTGGTNGSLGVGGDGGERASGNDGGGGGGGGYFGGGGGGAYGGGAGGSSFTEAGASNVTSALGAIGAAPYVTISYEIPPAASVAVTTSKTSIAADGTSTAVVTATLTDAFGTRVAGDTVVFGSSDPGQSFSPVTDNGDGTYTATVTSSTTVHVTVISASDQSVVPAISGTVSIAQVAILAATGTDPTGGLVAAVILLLAGAAVLAPRRPSRRPAPAVRL